MSVFFTNVITRQISISHEEFTEGDYDSPQESWQDDGLHATRTLKCAWADRHTLAAELVGGPAIIGGNLVLYLPQPYPHATGFNCYVKSIGSVRGFGQPDQSAAYIQGAGTYLKYTYAILQVEYAPLSYDVENSDEIFITENVEGSAEFITLPYKNLYWDPPDTTSDPGTKVQDIEAPGAVFRMMSWQYTLHKVAVIPDTIFSLMGLVNDASAKSPTYNQTFAAETLLWGMPSMRREISVTGVKMWEVTLNMTYKSTGWNKFSRAGVATPANIYTSDGSTFRPYTTGDFSGILPTP